MNQYNVGRINELPIAFVYKTDNINKVEKCVKDNLNDYRIKKHKNNETIAKKIKDFFNNETIKIDKDFIKETIIYCNKRKSVKLKQNLKLFNKKENNNWLIIFDKNNKYNINELYSKKNSKKTSKKVSKKTSKKINKK